MRLMTKDDGIKVLHPILDDLFNCVRAGYRDFWDLPADKKRKLTKRSRANLIRDFVVQALRDEFFDRDGVTVVESNPEDLFLMVVDGRLAIRFKKFDRYLRSKNNKTVQAQAFVQQELELSSPDVDTTPTYVDLGYTLSHPAEIDLRSIYLVCRNGRIAEWMFSADELLQNKTDYEFTNLPFEEDTEPRQRVRPKTLPDEQQKKRRVRVKDGPYSDGSDQKKAQ